MPVIWMTSAWCKKRSRIAVVQSLQQTPVTVPALRLETWAKQARIRRLDWVWMDLQGAELLALLGMSEMLHTVRALQLEIT